MNEINVGVIGAGIRGKLLGGAVRQNDGVRVVAIAEPNSTLREAAAKSFECASYDDYEQMLEQQTSINAVLICTPDFAHTDVALTVARRGLKFLIEKPLTMDALEATAIVEAAAVSGGSGMVAFENRWNPVFKQLKNDIDRGDIGEVRYQASSLNDTTFVPTQMLSWASKTTPGWFLMPHSLDISLWLSGRTPVNVMTKGSRGVCDALGVSTWDAMTSLIGLDDGTHITLDSNWILPPGMPQVFDFSHRVVGRDGAYEVSISEPGFKRYTQKYTGIGVAHREQDGRIVGMIDDMMRDFISFVREETTDVPDLNRGALVSRVIAACHRSLETGSSINIE